MMQKTKTKKPFTKSQMLRFSLLSLYQRSKEKETMDFEEFYEMRMAQIIGFVNGKER